MIHVDHGGLIGLLGGSANGFVHPSVLLTRGDP